MHIHQISILFAFTGMLGNAGAMDDRHDDDYDQGLNENHRTRQLLKVLAISDVVIYKSRAERLHTDLFYFMGDASKAYNEHFSSEQLNPYSHFPKSGKSGLSIHIDTSVALAVKKAHVGI